MRVNGSTIIGQLLDEHPEIEATLDWFGLDVTEIGEDSRISSLCRSHGLELNDFLDDLRYSIGEKEQEEFEDEDEPEDDDRDDRTHDDDD
jgi:hypothetical protein